MFNQKAADFYISSLKKSDRCKSCKYLKICRGGCRRYKELDENTKQYENKFCAAYKSFLDKNLERLIEIVNITKKIREENIKNA